MLRPVIRETCSVSFGLQTIISMSQAVEEVRPFLDVLTKERDDLSTFQVNRNLFLDLY